MRTPQTLLAATITWAGLGPATAQDAVALDAPSYADRLNQVPDPDRLREYHTLLASEPHDAGTPGDRAVVENLAALFESFGLAVEKQELSLYLSRPVSARVRVFAPDLDDAGLELPLVERPVEGDSFAGRTDDPDLRPGWNAYSGSGEVTAGVVYANHGRLEDFRRLEELGVSCAGKIVIARYGGNFRGYKAKYAEEAGAAGLIIYTDPQQDGWGRGLSWPEGGYANGAHIQRGSIKTLDYSGDPLTPFEPAFPDAERLSPEGVALPTIPVQPMGWDAAREILGRMRGPQAPGDWQGGLDFRYRLTGGDGLTVSLRVEQVRELTTTWNVIGTLPGAVEPEREVLIGAHHDSWGHGAGDSMCGMICVVESARAFGELAQRGVLPRRTVRFIGWAAEEHGIIGSTEYVESRVRELGADGVAYINLDMAAMGPNLGSSASPSLRGVVAEASRHVPQAGAPGETVWENWVSDPSDPGAMPRFGNLGGGSDHVGFLCHACVPSVSLGSGGSPGVSYHSQYDNLDWYRAIVGDDYEPALMITRMAVGIAARLAHEPVIPLDPTAYPDDVRAHLDSADPVEGVTESDLEHARTAARVPVLREGVVAPWRHPDTARLSPGQLDALNAELIAIERSWCADGFDDGRAWYRNGFAAPDATSGYAAWMLPGIRRALHEGDAAHLASQAEAIASWGSEFRDRIASIAALLGSLAPPGADAGDAPDPAGGRFQLETISITPVVPAPDDPDGEDDGSE
ncbi:MAG: M28 family peptidase [Phycisphaerales bacterium JB040]